MIHKKYHKTHINTHKYQSVATFSHHPTTKQPPKPQGNEVDIMVAVMSMPKAKDPQGNTGEIEMDQKMEEMEENVFWKHIGSNVHRTYMRKHIWFLQCWKHIDSNLGNIQHLGKCTCRTYMRDVYENGGYGGMWRIYESAKPWNIHEHSQLECER